MDIVIIIYISSQIFVIMSAIFFAIYTVKYENYNDEKEEEEIKEIDHKFQHDYNLRKRVRKSQ